MATPGEGGPANTRANTETSDQIVVHLRAVGSTPQLKHKKFAAERGKTIAWLVQWLKQRLECEEHQSMFVYIQQAFAPALDTELGALYECYGSSGKLVFHYCLTQAWG